MKKYLLLSAMFAVLIVPAVFAIPMHNINLNLGIALTGAAEIEDFYGSVMSESPRGYVVGLGYDFAPVEFISIGAGCNLDIRPFQILNDPLEDDFMYMAVEPFAQLRFYLPVMEGFDLFAGGGAGYAVLTNSTYYNDSTGITTPINGGALTYRFGGGIAYNQDLFTAVMDIGYKIASITPSPAITNAPNSDLIVNLGGLYFTMSATVSFGIHKQMKNEGEIKKQLDNEVNNLDTSTADASEETKKEDTASAAPLLQNQDDAEVPAERTASEVKVEATAEPVAENKTEDAAVETAAVESTPAAKATAAGEPAETATPVQEKPVEKVQIEENSDDTDGIIIISPGESETSELEKYITNKSKQFKQVEEEPEEGGDSGEDLVFNYDPEDAGIIVVEAESKGTVDKAGYVLVEKGGFISSNFTEDGYIYSLDEHKELFSAGDFAYIKLTAGIGAPKGKQFSIFDDSEEVINQAAGEPMGKMIKFLGVVKVTGPIEDNIFKVQIIKSYEPIRNNYKIKARQDLKKYHKEINLKVRKKNVEVRAFIVKVKDDIQNLKSRDLVYLDAGIVKGLLPGEKMGIFRSSTDAVSGKVSEYDRIGTLVIINSMQTSSVGLIVKSDGIIKVGDVVKTLGK